MVPLLRSPATLERFLIAAESSVLRGSRSIPVRAVRWWRTGVGMLAREVSPTVPWPLTPSHRPGCLGQSRWLSVDRAPTAMSVATTSSTLTLFVQLLVRRLQAMDCSRYFGRNERIFVPCDLLEWLVHPIALPMWIRRQRREQKTHHAPSSCSSQLKSMPWHQPALTKEESKTTDPQRQRHLQLLVNFSPSYPLS